MTKALVVLSGGQDSTTCLFWAKNNFKEVETITFDYGQRHRIEIDSAITIATIAGADFFEVVQVGDILEGSSPLTNKTEALETYSDFDTMTKIIGDRVEKTFVPMRNALFLVLAANRAAARGYNDIVTGVCQADGANYPDCTEIFINDMRHTIETALAQDFRIHTPLINMTKAESVKFAMTMPGCYRALAYSHTAYDGQYPPTGKDHASVLRAHGFVEANVPDPLVVRAALEGKMELPKSFNYWHIHDLVQNIKRIIPDLGIPAALDKIEQQVRLYVR